MLQKRCLSFTGIDVLTFVVSLLDTEIRERHSDTSMAPCLDTFWKNPRANYYFRTWRSCAAMQVRVEQLASVAGRPLHESRKVRTWHWREFLHKWRKWTLASFEKFPPVYTDHWSWITGFNWHEGLLHNTPNKNWLGSLLALCLNSRSHQSI